MFVCATEMYYTILLQIVLHNVLQIELFVCYNEYNWQ